MQRKRIAASFVACIAMVVGMFLLPAAAHADVVQSCAKELNISKPSARDAKEKTPVILVHGWNSSRDVWGSYSDGGSTARALSAKNTAIYPFDYESEHYTWVTDGDADYRLAKTIVCFSKLYNDKKVVVVAHSMGGLLARAAVALDAYDVQAADAVGHIVTIGTPHTGTLYGTLKYVTDRTTCNLQFAWWGGDDGGTCDTHLDTTASSAMRLDSEQLAALPKFPSGVTVKAIAGNLTHHFCALWACTDIALSSDLVAGTGSATDEYSSTHVGDGKQLLACKANFVFVILTDGWCGHNNLLQAKAAQSSVKSSINAYLAAVKKAETQPKLPPHRMYDFFSRFTLPFLNTWGTSMSSPNELLNIVDNTQCNASNVDCPHINVVDLSSAYAKEVYGASSPMAIVAQQFCSTDDQQYDGQFASLKRYTIGGKSTEYYSQLRCLNGPNGPIGAYAWYIPERQLLVVAYDSQQNKITPDVITAVLSGIEWK